MAQQESSLIYPGSSFLFHSSLFLYGVSSDLSFVPISVSLYPHYCLLIQKGHSFQLSFHHSALSAGKIKHYVSHHSHHQVTYEMSVVSRKGRMGSVLIGWQLSPPHSFAQFKQPSAFHGRSLVSSVESRSFSIRETDPEISISSEIFELCNKNSIRITLQKCGEICVGDRAHFTKFPCESEIRRSLLSAMKEINPCSLVLLIFVFYSFRLLISPLSLSTSLFSYFAHSSLHCYQMLPLLLSFVINARQSFLDRESPSNVCSIFAVLIFWLFLLVFSFR